MAVKSKEDLMNSIKQYVGENSDDAVLIMLEDIEDTFDDLAVKLAESGDWKSKYEMNDRAWREKYRERFFSNDIKVEENQTVFMTSEVTLPPEEETRELTIEDLFTYS